MCLIRDKRLGGPSILVLIKGFFDIPISSSMAQTRGESNYKTRAMCCRLRGQTAGEGRLSLTLGLNKQEV